ncbi:MAG: tRNA uridine-5-carboxymethylaminomethyl(34) synthesis GTPase MnmE [Thermonemataceae bacterium]|nr:tRNA uridine-5-carboxymethylaminomethyl(34) synthesis GTPase MnmE [Thermonemataceae bacterium]
MNDTIIALATPQGNGAIALIRLSGKESITLVEQVFYGKKLSQANTHSVHFGTIRKNEQEILDEVLVTIFREPHSFTKENSIEIACHGSMYIVEQILQLLLQKGARLAKPGEFSQRAFLNGRFDLAQAEAIADLINAETEAAHQIAIRQMRGSFSSELRELRSRLLHFVSLLELELDFGEEDVEFADRKQLLELIEGIRKHIQGLISSFRLGNVIKKGVPVAIVGKPNAGKSTLLNALLGENKAIVSPIAGTTRDVIEDTLNIKGITFRFMDTAGLRETDDLIEKIGVEKALEKMQEAAIILYMCNGGETFDNEQESPYEADKKAQIYQEQFPHAKVVLVANKIDLRFDAILWGGKTALVAISAKEKTNLEELKESLYQWATKGQDLQNSGSIISNTRHLEALQKTTRALENAKNNLVAGLSQEFVAMDIREAIAHLAAITGDISTEDILGNIFSTFCIGK